MQQDICNIRHACICAADFHSTRRNSFSFGALILSFGLQKDVLPEKFAPANTSGFLF